MKNKKIAVVMGGPSAEREVSLNTGNAILKALQEKGYKAVGIDMDPKQIASQLQEEKIDIVFNAIHGKFGEDGALQGALDMLGIPYTGSGVMASAITMDKSISKRLFVAAGLPTAPAEIYDQYSLGLDDICQDIRKKFTFPLVVKAAEQGSSIGVYILEDESGLQDAVRNAFGYCRHIVVEAFITGSELTVAVMGNKEAHAFPVIEIVPHSGRYDYHSKYTSGATEYIVPARLDEQTTHKLQQLAEETYRLVGCKGIARVDFMMDKEKHPYILEINTIPGMTATSLVPKAAAATGLLFADLCEKLLLMAVE
ncbi:D-alanine--D-alanine ligase [Sporomusaceae bacterium BoRhaA]|uniref:D-alanine--D-alanine ligase n=1 Tax=Pelorhabdus rhamnosifermentans TaxID=2772457 RepID=UPI001C05EFD3|nr:D-alanine--D-alanine ligase [Pelorhabdus rhamnosifermentans]MBU2702985.1 D-alanine--D-alanine ligase [Pelorhabdus rhamnosifermentans]